MRFLPVTLFLIATTLLGADNPFLGTWKLNTSKSKSSPGPVAQSMTVEFEADGENIKRTVTGVDGQGKPIMQGGPEGTSIPWDGKDHEVKVPDGPPMTVAVKRNGKITATIRSVVSKDGKTMTNTIDGVDEKEVKIHEVEVLEKQ